MKEMEEAKRLIEQIEKQLIEVKYHVGRGATESAAIKSEYVKLPAIELYNLLNQKSN